MTFFTKFKSFFSAFLVLSSTLSTLYAAAPAAESADAFERSGNLGIIRGMVRDNSGSPIANATVAIFRAGTSKLLKQVQSGSDGSFLAKIMPGTYTVLAVAEGFNPVTLAAIEVSRASQLSYGFKLERSGGGNTLPEKRLDRNNPKWNIRAAQTSRTIYQNAEGSLPVGDANAAEATLESVENIEEPEGRSGQTVVETYFAASGSGTNGGINAATLVPISENAEIIFAGQ
ncbi:MAG: carboxypeptidase-like regulatory domain-containing protein, partial [Pyrinomonadaceae bacterium]